MLIYIHGFNSSPASFKAQLLKARLEASGRGAEFAAPTLPHNPARAASMLDALAERYPGAALVGSSLGGYYATWLSEKHGLKTVLLNPAVRPYALLAGRVGPQRNLYSGESYEFNLSHIEELRALEVTSIVPGRYLLITATEDEVLDYRAALDRYRGCRQVVIEGSNHGLTDFSDHVETVLEFCGLADSHIR